MIYRERASEIAGVLQALGGSGIVHNRSRNTPLWGKFVELFRSGDRINGWQISRKRLVINSPRVEETYLLTKILGMHDATESELLFQENLDEAVAAFREGLNLTFGEVADGLRILGTEERVFGDAVCHVAECELVVSMYYVNL